MKNSLFAALFACAFACLATVEAAQAQSRAENRSQARAANNSAAAATAVTAAASTSAAEPPARQIYEWRIYTLKPGADAALLDDFFRSTLIPAYNDRGIDVGAFAPADAYPEFPAGARLLFIAWPDFATFRSVGRSIREDADFLSGGADFFTVSAPDPVYTNLETYLCEAFDGFPLLRRPAAERGLFELRVYRSPNVEANERKIRMFESGEIAVFDAVGVNVVCFGRTLAGPRMESLTYLTWYRDAAARAEAWSRFGAHPEWQRMRVLPEYAHTATDNTSRLLAPMPYSQY